MKLGDANKLIIDEQNGQLKNPIFVLNKDKKELVYQQKMFTILVNKIIENPNRKEFIQSSIGKCIMRTYGIKSIKSVDERYGLFQGESKFGDFVFFDSHRLFPTGKYPMFIKEGYCHSNALCHVLFSKQKAKVVSGIAYFGKPFLHSIIETKQCVIDFNYNIVITKELYYKLLSFEKLNEIESDDLLNRSMQTLLDLNINSCQLVLAYDDLFEKCDDDKKVK